MHRMTNFDCEVYKNKKCKTLKPMVINTNNICIICTRCHRPILNIHNCVKCQCFILP